MEVPVRYVPAEGAPFGYTVGLTMLGQPELLMFGFGSENTAELIGELAGRVFDGEVLAAGRLVAFTERVHRAVLVPVPDSSEFLVEANRLYRRAGEPPVPALQVVVDDKWGNFPWETGYRLPPGRQPVLGGFPVRPQ